MAWPCPRQAGMSRETDRSASITQAMHCLVQPMAVRPPSAPGSGGDLQRADPGGQVREETTVTCRRLDATSRR